MFGRISGYFLLLVLVLDPSNAFLAEKCNIDLEWYENILKQNEVSLRLVLRAARVLLSFFKENPDLAKEYPSVLGFVQQLLRQGLEMRSAANLAFFGAIVYLGGVAISSYCFLVHSQEQLAEAQYIEKKLDLIIVGEVKPILDHIETLLKGGEARVLCNKRTQVKDMLEDRRNTIRNIVHSIKKLKKENIKGKEQSRVLKSVVAGGAVIGIGAVIAAPIAAPASVLVAGAFGIGGILGYKWLDESQLTYQEALEILEKAENKASEAEKAITKLQTNVELVCSLGFKKIESEFKWKLMLEAEEKKTKAELISAVAAAGLMTKIL